MAQARRHTTRRTTRTVPSRGRRFAFFGSAVALALMSAIGVHATDADAASKHGKPVTHTVSTSRTVGAYTYRHSVTDTRYPDSSHRHSVSDSYMRR